MMYSTQTQAPTSVKSVSLSALKVAGAIYVVECEEEEGRGVLQGPLVLEEFDNPCNETDSCTVVGLLRASNTFKKT